MAYTEPEDPGRPLADHELVKRREALASKLAAQRARLEPVRTSSGSGMKGAADGMKLASEFVGGVLAGAGIGYLLDLLAGTGPFGLIVFLILGFVAGVLNVLRSIGKTTPAATQAPKEAVKEEVDRR